MELNEHEQQWLDAQRRLGRQVFVGIDHHTAQFTVAVAAGEQLRQRPDPAQLTVVRFSQDGLGYRQFLDWLCERFPDAATADFCFLAEPSYSQPLRHFLLGRGFRDDQVLWVNTAKAAQYRKTHDLSRSGKNDDADARTLVLLLYEALVAPSSRLGVFPGTTAEPRHEALRQLSTEYQRLTDQSIQLQNKVFQLVLRLFPECRLVFIRRARQRKPDGSSYTAELLDLFGTATPLRVLRQFPTPRRLREAGFDRVWQHVGGKGVKKATIRRLLELAAVSAGIPDELAAARLTLLIDEYDQLQARLQQYRMHMRQLLAEDPVLASLLRIPALTEVTLAGLVGEMGDLDRCHTADQLKRYLALAPRPMPHSGQVDAAGRVVQRWRMPANTYRRVSGQRQLVYRVPGKRTPRVLAWLWFNHLVQGSSRHLDDPFVRYYQVCKARLQGQPRWLGRARWKVVGKLIRVIFTCVKQRQAYDPARLQGPKAQEIPMTATA